MQTSQKLQKLSLVLLSSAALHLSCGSGHKFTPPNAPTEKAPIAGEDVTIGDDSPITDEDGTISNLPKPDPILPVVPDPMPVACSTLYGIPGIANPFLAGMPDGTEIAYPASVDRAPANSPILVTPTDRQCFEAGRNLYFRVEGKIAHGSNVDQESDADGMPTAPDFHRMGGLFGLSNVKAPINSLIGIFLDDKLPAQRLEAPETLDFNTGNGQNFKNLQPKLGQIFFIGDGKDTSGKLQSFTVPEGTTRLYLAVMDAYEWNNNFGKLSGGILWVKP